MNQCWFVTLVCVLHERPACSSSPRRVHALGRTKSLMKETSRRPSVTHNAPDVTATHTDDNRVNDNSENGRETHTQRHTKKNPNRKPGARTMRFTFPARRTIDENARSNRPSSIDRSIDPLATDARARTQKKIQSIPFVTSHDSRKETKSYLILC